MEHCQVATTSSPTLVRVASRACAILVLVVSWPAVGSAQELADCASPRIALEADAAEYRLFEPVVLTVRVTNLCDVPQLYGRLNVIGSLLDVRITDPQGKPVRLYGEPGNLVSLAAPGPGDAPVEPGETQASSMLLSYFYPLTAMVGRYEIRVQLRPIGSTQVARASTFIRVVSPGSPELVRELIEPFGRAVGDVRGLAMLDRIRLEAIERVNDSTDPALSYLAESAAYYLALFDQKISEMSYQHHLPPERRINLESRRPAERAEREFERFLQRFPNSVFATEAHRGLREARARNGLRD